MTQIRASRHHRAELAWFSGPNSGRRITVLLIVAIVIDLACLLALGWAVGAI